MQITPKHGSKLHEWLGHTDTLDVYDGYFSEHLSRISDQHPKLSSAEQLELAAYAAHLDPRVTLPLVAEPAPERTTPTASEEEGASLCDVLTAINQASLTASREHTERRLEGWVQFCIKALILLAMLVFISGHGK